MKILPPSHPSELFHYLKLLRYELARWLIVEIKLIDPSKIDFTTQAIGSSLEKLYEAYEGRILVCNTSEILMLIDWGVNKDIKKLEQGLAGQFPETSCEIKVAPPTKEGLHKIELQLMPKRIQYKSLYEAREARKTNVFLIADDDMYIRLIAKKGLQELGAAIEVGIGSEVVSAYEACNPDLVLLDIHLPGLSGQEVLEQLKVLDPYAYVVMLSADSSPENVKWTQQHGAKGFLTKPFDKEHLMRYAKSCPTVT